jgi:hypothetical protein
MGFMRETIKSYINDFFSSQDVYLEPKIERQIDMDYILKNIYSWDERTTKNLVRSFAALANEVKELLPYYGTIVSDDASGRLVSLFFRKIVNRKREELGKEPVSTYFLTPRRGKYKEINEEIDDIQRSTVLSFIGMIRRSMLIFLNPVVGILVDTKGVFLTFILLGIVSLVSIFKTKKRI